MSFLNLSKLSETDLEEDLSNSLKFQTIISLQIILLALILNFLVVLFLLRKNLNPRSVFLIFLSLNHSLYLVVYIFQDIIKACIEIYYSKKSNNLHVNILYMLDLIDRYDYLCRLINYLSHVLRFNTACLVCSISLQHLLIVYDPFHKKSVSTKLTCRIATGLMLPAFILNIWPLFVYELNADTNGTTYCNINQEASLLFFDFKKLFNLITIFVPNLILFTTNGIIFYKLKNSNVIIQADELPTNSTKRVLAKETDVLNQSQINVDESYLERKFHALGSFVYAALNFPYLVIWFYLVYFKMETHFHSYTNTIMIYQIVEVVYNLDFSAMIFLYCVSVARFRDKSESLSNNNLI